MFKSQIVKSQRAQSTESTANAPARLCFLASSTRQRPATFTIHAPASAAANIGAAMPAPIAAESYSGTPTPPTSYSGPQSTESAMHAEHIIE